MFVLGQRMVRSGKVKLVRVERKQNANNGIHHIRLIRKSQEIPWQCLEWRSVHCDLIYRIYKLIVWTCVRVILVFCSKWVLTVALNFEQYCTSQHCHPHNNIIHSTHVICCVPTQFSFKLFVFHFTASTHTDTHTHPLLITIAHRSKHGKSLTFSMKRVFHPYSFSKKIGFRSHLYICTTSFSFADAEKP